MCLYHEEEHVGEVRNQALKQSSGSNNGAFEETSIVTSHIAESPPSHNAIESSDLCLRHLKNKQENAVSGEENGRLPAMCQWKKRQRKGNNGEGKTEKGQAGFVCLLRA